jgi:hypothetical protein
MNCDQVFDILTRGPFPTGDASDRDVERHLDGCYECARLAEALRPALDLLHESIPAEEGRDLPGYWGDLVGRYVCSVLVFDILMCACVRVCVSAGACIYTYKYIKQQCVQ